jgi:CRP-like cAMP-binding protein
VAKKGKVSFDPKRFLAKVGDGKTIAKYQPDQIVFSQGEQADAVFYIQKGKLKLTVISEQGKEAVIAIWDPVTSSAIFFIGYFFFEVPSNLALNKFGARVWIACIMFTWGLISGAQAFVVGEASLNIVRLLLGIAEAGFFPGIIFSISAAGQLADGQQHARWR